MKSEQPCGRPAYLVQGHCLFHADDKPEAEFVREFDALIATAGEHAMLDFTRFVFPAIRFQKTVFRHWMDFDHCIFRGDFAFSDCTFERSVTFHWARFESYVLFNESRFKEGVSVQRATFAGVAEWIDVTIEGTADFHGAVFEKDAHFRKVDFGAESFDPSKTSRSASFGQATFDGTVYFGNLTVRCSMTFQGARFQREAFFQDVRVVDDSNRPEEKVRVDFTSVRAAQVDGVQFTGRAGQDHQPQPLDLSRFQFAFSDVGRMRFENVRWRQAPALLGRERGRAIVRVSDEEDLKTPYTSGGDAYRSCNPGLDLEHVSHIYKGLRISYERNLQFAEAGEFHVRDMEMRRLGGKATHPFGRWWQRNFSLVNVYRVLSNYGESYARPFSWSLVVVGVFTLAYVWLDWTWKDASLRSFTAFLPSLEAAGATWPVAVERVLGVILLSLFALALRRRFKR